MTLPTRVVGVLGGMGPAAGVDFVRLFVQACTQRLIAHGEPVTDQAFPEHWLAQLPVPDRTVALAAPPLGSHSRVASPLDAMARALGQLAGLGCRAVAIACNTAHAWHGELQARFAQVELLHVAHEVAAQLAGQGAREVALMATEGTYQTRLYQDALEAHGLICHLPLAPEREVLMRGVYQGVKAGDLALGERCCAQVAESLARRYQGAPIVMGCTEVPLALQGCAAVAELPLIDAARVLAQALAARAYADL